MDEAQIKSEQMRLALENISPTMGSETQHFRVMTTRSRLADHNRSRGALTKNPGPTFGVLRIHQSLVNTKTTHVERIRTKYLKEAVLRVAEMAADSEADACKAAGELRRYFEWVQDDLPPEERGSLFKEVRSLTGKFLRSESARS